MSRFGGFPGLGGAGQGPPGTTPTRIPGVFITPGGGLVDRFGMPQVGPSDDASRQQAGFPGLPGNGSPLGPGQPLSPTRTPLPGTPGHIPFVGTPQIPPPGTPGRESFPQPAVSQSAAPGTAQAPASPNFFFSLQQPPQQQGPTDVRQQLANDPRRTVQAGSLEFLSNIFPSLLAGMGSGLNLGGLNQALQARQSAAEADINAGAEGRRLQLRQDLARRGILNSGLAAGAEADINATQTRGLGSALAGIQGVGAQADLQSQQLGANQALEQRRMIFDLLRGIPGLESIFGAAA